VPYGYSMGGGIVMAFLYNSPLASSVSGVVLDAPMLDLARVIDQAGGQRHVPGLITSTARFITEQRFDVEFDDMAYLGDVDQLDAPILLFHGDDDDRVPVGTSDDVRVDSNSPENQDGPCLMQGPSYEGDRYRVRSI
jgi:pimeloyl-ACP methyl ester carboxylesterase